MGLLDVIQGASNAAASNVSGPVDMLAWALRKAGVPVPQNPVMGEQWMREKGLLATPQNKYAGAAGETLGLLAPFGAAAKAPQIAKGLLAGEEATKRGAYAVAEKGNDMAQGYMARQGLQRNIFMGETSRTWDKAAAERAMALEKSGADPRSIWSETGTFKGADGKWRQEISDHNVRPLDRTWGEAADLSAGSSTVTRRQRAIAHPALSAAYPETKDLIVSMKPGSSGSASFSSGGVFGDEIALSVDPKYNYKADPSTMLHELQHAVQHREGFARGGNPAEAVFKDGPLGMEMLAIKKEAEDAIGAAFQRKAALRAQYPGARAKDLNRVASYQEATRAINEYKNLDPAMEAYRRLAGEAEARAVQSRMNLTPAQRRALFPFDSYDRPQNALIVR